MNKDMTFESGVRVVDLKNELKKLDIANYSVTIRQCNGTDFPPFISIETKNGGIDYEKNEFYNLMPIRKKFDFNKSCGLPIIIEHTITAVEFQAILLEIGLFYPKAKVYVKQTYGTDFPPYIFIR